MNRKTLGVQRPQLLLNDAPDMKARSYSLALCGLDVRAWRRHPKFGCQKSELPQFIIIIIIKNVKIRVTLSWITLQGHFTELLK